MNDRVVAVLTTNHPTLCTAAPQKSSEVFGINEDPRVHCQSDHLLWRVGVVELMLNLWVTIHQMAEVIQSIQKRLRVSVHTAEAGEAERYSGDEFHCT
jgi:hypothetical protein